MSSIDTDTGFNRICVCCGEYKSRSSVTGIQVLSKKQQDLYLSTDRKVFMSKDRKRYICKSCRQQIDRNKTPSKSQKDKETYSKFPIFLKNHLKKSS